VPTGDLQAIAPEPARGWKHNDASCSCTTVRVKA